ncbi:MAG: hypothetical protein ACXW2E_01860 [Nitrososphaeraceae archaeon]
MSNNILAIAKPSLFSRMKLQTVKLPVSNAFGNSVETALISCDAVLDILGEYSTVEQALAEHQQFADKLGFPLQTWYSTK